MGYYRNRYDSLRSSVDCNLAKRAIEDLYEKILGLTKVTPLHKEKLYNDFLSYCRKRDNVIYENGTLDIIKRRKELSFLHLKKHMETELTEYEVKNICENLTFPQKLSRMIFNNFLCLIHSVSPTLYYNLDEKGTQ